MPLSRPEPLDRVVLPGEKEWKLVMDARMCGEPEPLAWDSCQDGKGPILTTRLVADQAAIGSRRNANAARWHRIRPVAAAAGAPKGSQPPGPAGSTGSHDRDSGRRTPGRKRRRQLAMVDGRGGYISPPLLDHDRVEAMAQNDISPSSAGVGRMEHAPTNPVFAGNSRRCSGESLAVASRDARRLLLTLNCGRSVSDLRLLLAALHAPGAAIERG